MPALCSMLLGTCYAQNYASIIGGSLSIVLSGDFFIHLAIIHKIILKWIFFYTKRLKYSNRAVMIKLGIIAFNPILY